MASLPALAEFINLMGLDEQTVYRDADGMEHHSSPGSLNANPSPYRVAAGTSRIPQNES